MRCRLSLRLALLVLGCALALPATAHAAEFTVNSLADPGSDDCDASQCTLREAMVAAAATDGPDTIGFASGLSGEVPLASPLPTITSGLAIAGPGAEELAIGRRPDGAGARRIFRVGGDGDATITGLTIRDGTAVGQPGGGVLVEGGSLVLREVAMHGNVVIGPSAFGGAIASLGGHLTVIDSQIGAPGLFLPNELIGPGPARGAGIYSSGGSLTVRGSSIAHNEAHPESGTAQGGGIYASGAAVKIERSTISNNTSSNQAGDGSGGGVVLVNTGDSELAAVTIADNQAEEAASLFANGGVSVRGSILAAPDGSVNCNTGSSLSSAGLNLVSDSSCGLQADSDRQGVDPALEPLARNGGPTLSHAIGPGSPALDQGHASDFEYDQRGLVRTFDDPDADAPAGGDGTDIGAFERQPLHVNSTAEPGSGGCDLDECTVREAIDASAGSAAADRIEVDPDLSGTITLTDHLPRIEHDLVFLGPGADKLSIDGNGTFRPFSIFGGDIELSGVEITGGWAPYGGGIANKGNLTLSRVIVSENSAETSGGGIANFGTLKIEDSAIVGNGIVANNNLHAGGGIWNDVTTGPDVEDPVAVHLELRRSTVSGNFIRTPDGDPIGWGGGIYLAGVADEEMGVLEAAAEIVDSTLASNTAGGFGRPNLAATIHLQGRASAKIGNTILADPVGGPHCAHSGSTWLESTGYNLVSGEGGGAPVHSCVGRIFAPTDPGLGGPTDRLGVDPGLKALGDNGGPTPTHAISPSSPAHDQGRSDVARDQRGFARPVDQPEVGNAEGGDGSDIGAFELELSDLEPPAPDPPSCRGKQATIVAMPGRETLGTRGADVIVGTPGDDVIRTFGGDDVVCARGGDDRVSAGKGKDVVFAGAGDDEVHGRRARDRVVGGPGADVLRGGRGDDALIGRAGADRILGGPGRDLLVGGPGPDRCNGGSGRNRARSCEFLRPWGG